MAIRFTPDTPAPAVRFTPDTPASQRSRVLQHVLDVAGAITETPRNLEVGFLEAGESLLRSVQRRGTQKPVSDELIRELGFEPTGTPWEPPAISRKAGEMAENVAATKKRALRKLEPVTLRSSPVRRLTRPVVQNLPQYGAMLGASVLSGTPLAGLALGAEMSGGSTFQQQVESHGDVKMANIVADLSGLTEAAGESLVFPKFIKGLSKGLPLREALLLVAENAGQEGATGFVQAFIESMGDQIAKGIDPKKAAKVAFDEGVKAVPENAWVGGAMGLLPAGGGYLRARQIAGTPTPTVEVRPANAPPYQDEAAPLPEIGGTQPQPLPPGIQESLSDLPIVEPQAVEPPQAPAASATEPASADEAPVSRIRHAATKEIADKMGLTPAPMPPHESRPQWYEEAFEGGDPDRLVPIASAMLEQEPRALTTRETAGFDLAIQKLDTEWNEAAKTRLGMSKSDPQFAILTARMNAAAAALDPIRRVTDPAGRIAGQQLVARRRLSDTLNDDTSALSVVTRATTIKGDKLTETEQEQLTQDAEKVKEGVEKLKGVEQQLAAEEIGLPVEPPPRRKGRKRRAVRRRPRGVERYAKMTEAEKNTELQQLLTGDISDPLIITRIAENIASRPEVQTFEEVLNRVGALLPTMTQNTLIDAISEAGRRKAVQSGAMTARIRGLLKGPARTNTKLGELFQDILYYLERGEVRDKTRALKDPEPEINRKLRESVGLMRQMQRNSLSEVQAHLEEQIAFLEARLANEDYAPRKTRKQRPQYERELHRQRAEIAKLRSTIRDRFEKIRPRDTWQKIGHVVNELFHLQKAIKGSIDDSAFGNQGGWQLRAHPIRSLRRLPWAYKGVLSDADALRMQAEIDERPNAWMDHAFGLTMRDVTGNVTFTHGEDLLRTTWAQHIPVLKHTSAASNRLFALRINRIAADALDAWVAAAYKPGEAPTLVEGRAMANLVNITLGRGDVGRLNQAVEVAGSVMWAPRKFVNDVQLAIHLPLILRQPRRVRNYFIKEIARHTLGSVLLWAIMSAVWGRPEEDPRSSMFLQWRIPGTNTYVSPFGPLPRILALMRQIWSGERKTKAGDIVPTRGTEVPYGGSTGWDLLSQMVQNRLAPGPRVLSETFLTGTDFKGDETTFWRSMAESITPIAPEDIYKVLREDMGVPDTVASSAMAYLGASVNVHEQTQRPRVPAKRTLRRRTRSRE